MIPLVERKEYLERLAQWKDEQVIKVITGIRRCGKSTLLLQYQTWLKANGVSAEQIVSVNFEELEYEELLDYRKLYEYEYTKAVLFSNSKSSLELCISVSTFNTIPDDSYLS